MQQFESRADNDARVYSVTEAGAGMPLAGASGATISWRAIIAGVITFLAMTVMLSLITLGIGLGGEGVGAGVWSIIALAIALAAAGYVAGSVALRSGFVHGFLTFATSLVVTLGLTVWLSASLLGAVGGMANSAAQLFSDSDVMQTVETAESNIDEGDKADAKQTAEEVADTAQTSAWWSFAGLVVGAAIATGMGALGVRTRVTKRVDL